MSETKTGFSLPVESYVKTDRDSNYRKLEFALEGENNKLVYFVDGVKHDIHVDVSTSGGISLDDDGNLTLNSPDTPNLVPMSTNVAGKIAWKPLVLENIKEGTVVNRPGVSSSNVKCLILDVNATSGYMLVIGNIQINGASLASGSELLMLPYLASGNAECYPTYYDYSKGITNSFSIRINSGSNRIVNYGNVTPTTSGAWMSVYLLIPTNYETT